MKIRITKQEKEKIDKLLYSKERNIDAANIYIAYLEEYREDIDFNLLSYYRKQLNNDINKAYYRTFLSVLDIDYDDPEYLAINNNCHLDSMKELNPSIYRNNPYYQNIKFEKHKENKWEITNLYYRPLEGFVYNELDINNANFEETTPFGFFKEKFSYPAVIENDTIWMSITPHEIETMKDSIEKAHDNVLVIGLGLGYYAYMVSLKENVNKVTIIEKDKNVINLFNKFILPQFSHKDKIEVINEDAYNFLDEVNIDNYQYCFSDIWHNVGDGEELYLLLKSREKENIEYDYWIETSILAMLRRQILTLFEEELSGSDDSIYTKANDFNDEVINRLHYLLKDVEINSYDNLKTLLLDVNLKVIAKELNIRNFFKPKF